MNINTDTTKMTVVRIDPENQLVILGTTFRGTLDKKNYFPKRISLYCKVQDSMVLNDLSKVPIGNEILATVTSDLESGVNYLDSFSRI